MAWKDISSFSAGDKVCTPNAFELNAGGFRLRVHRHIHHAPDAWLLTCDPWFKCLGLGSGTAETACGDALRVVLGRVDGAAYALRSNVEMSCGTPSAPI